MAYHFNNDSPIYLQLVHILEIDIITGKLKAGERIPSVRDLSKIYQVNPNTIQKALQELENQKLIYTERTNGKFVTKENKVIDESHNEHLKKLMKEFIKKANDLEINESELMNFLKKYRGE